VDKPVATTRSEVARLAVALAGLLILSVLWLLLSHLNHNIAREHGPMENLQAAFLFAAFLVLMHRAARPGRTSYHESLTQPSYPPNLGTRILYTAMAAGYFTFLALEFDVRPLESKWLTLIFNGPIRNAWMLIAWAIIAVFAFRNLPQVLAAFHAWRRTSSAVLLASSALFWAAGAVAEKWFSKLNPSHYFMEEFMESHATWLMLLAAIFLKSSQPLSSTIQSLRPERGSVTRSV
jgi:hypothetical protein